jgi:hypothetical protein
MLSKLRIALAATLLALAGASAIRSASAAIIVDTDYRFTGPSGGFYWLSDGTILGEP